MFRFTHTSARLCFYELLEARRVMNASFDYSAVAVTGSGNSFVSLGRGPSINDRGVVAFLGRQSRDGGIYENLFTRDPATNTTQKLMNSVFELPTSGAAATQTLGERVQVNDNDQVLAWRNLNALVQIGPPFGEIVSTPLTYIERWPVDGNVNNPGMIGLPSQRMVGGDPGLRFVTPLPGYLFLNPATGGVYPSAVDLTSGFDAVFREVAFNNSNQVSFEAMLHNSSRVRATGQHANGTFLGGPINNFPLRPAMADNGDVVFATTATSGIGGSLIRESFDFSQLEFIATSSNGFTTVGGRPGISDDGSVIVFAGTVAAGNAYGLSAGSGIFLADKAPNGSRRVSRLAGLSGNGMLDPGESFVDNNRNGVFDAGEIDNGPYSGFDLSAKVAVGKQESDWRVAFSASTATSSFLATCLTQLSGNSYSTREHEAVVSTGETIRDLLLVNDFGIHDGVNDAGAITFWASSLDGKQAVYVASSRDADRDGLYDHWEDPTKGIDSNNDGIYDLNLYLLGARSNRKDLFVELDSTGSLLFSYGAENRVVHAFDQSPVVTSGGVNGIKLHILRGSNPVAVTLSAGADLNAQITAARELFIGDVGDSVATIAAKKLAFRYCLYSDAVVLNGGDLLGRAVGTPGNAFFVGLGSTSLVSNQDAQAATFMHEFGHTLGLGHGGATDDRLNNQLNYKPNYVSLMNYTWTLPNFFQTPAPGSGAASNAWKLDYSRIAYPDLNENALFEPVGIQGRANVLTVIAAPGVNPANTRPTWRLVNEFGDVDFDNDLSNDASAVRVDINGDDKINNLKSSTDWDKLIYKVSSGTSVELLNPNNESLTLQDYAALLEAGSFGRPPRVAATFDIDAGHDMSIWFQKDVGPSLDLVDVQLMNITTGEVIPNQALFLVYDSVLHLATLHLSGFPLTRLPDGEYQLRVSAAGVTDRDGRPLDADGDGIGGDDLLFTFHVLQGDANGDHRVDFDDLLILAQSYGQSGRSFSQGNFDYDINGNVGFDDLLLVAQRYGISLLIPETKKVKRSPMSTILQ